jgi:hypothetical protein
VASFPNSFPDGVAYNASDFKELTQTVMNVGSTYVYMNYCEVLIDGEVRVGNGSASFDLFAEVITSASLSSEDHGGVSINNYTSGGVVAHGSMIAAFGASTSYSVMVITADPASDRYVEGTGDSVSKQEIENFSANSIVSGPAGIPGTFYESADASAIANVQFTILYGPGATQGNPVGPTAAPTRATRGAALETFDAVYGGRWYASGLSDGFLYEALGGTIFTEVINLPNGFSGTVSIWSEGALLGQYQAGDFFRFEDILGHGVTSFSVLGIVPEAGVDSFPIQLGFDTEAGSFQQSALTTSPGAGRSAQLLLGKSGAGDLQLDWQPSCSMDDNDYAIYAGNMGDFISHTIKSCSTSGATTATITPFGGDRYYLVVPLEGASEGSYGRDSAGSERLVGLATCGTQDIASTCP